jgi:8-oxo-dGTP pyrophosphatase MutT (NUDIX family)
VKQSVASIILTENRDQVLLVKRRDVPIWVLPGGGVDAGEMAETAAIRESLEETGLTVSIARKIGEYTPCNRLALLTHLYECRPIGGTLTLSDETSAVAFFPIAEAKKLIFSIHADWLDDFLANSPTVIRKPLTNVNYWALFKYFCRHPWHVIRFACSLLGG